MRWRHIINTYGEAIFANEACTQLGYSIHDRSCCPGREIRCQNLHNKSYFMVRPSRKKTPLPLRSTSNRSIKHPGGIIANTPNRFSTQSTANGINNTNRTAIGHQSSSTYSNSGSGQNNMSNLTMASTTSGDSPQHTNKSPERRRVEYEPISFDDIQLINEISERSVQAVRGLKVISQEQVITHFRP